MALSVVFAVTPHARAGADFDQALEKLITDTRKAVIDSQKRKVVVLNFTSITGGTSAFGKFLAEQVSVGLVESKSQLTVVDRDNLKAILDEYQLTEEGLVKPENARKLGQFTGVEALVIGSITSVDSGHLITVKVISTDKAEICGAVRGKLPLNPDFDAVLRSGVPGPTIPAAGSKKPGRPTERVSGGKEFESELFKARFSRMQILRNGEILVLADFFNSVDEEVVPRLFDPNLRGWRFNYFSSIEKAEAARKAALRSISTVLRSTNGDEWRLAEVVGMDFPSSRGDLPSLSASSPTTVTFRFKAASERATIPGTTTFTFDSELCVFARPRERSSSNYREAGVVTVHMDGLR